MDKQKLRKKYKELRAQLTAEQRDEMSLDIANQALQLDIWKYNYYHIFLPIERLYEINTEYLLSILSGKDKNILLSKSDFATGTMENYLLTDNTRIVVNNYGIPEPEDGIEVPFSKAEVIFVPLLAYDTHGNRVGYGKGFYDRFLAQCSPDALKIGLSYFEPESTPLITNTTDIPLDYCVSAKEVYRY